MPRPTHVIITHDAIEVPETVQGLVGTAEDLRDLKGLLIQMFRAWSAHERQEAATDEPLVKLA